MTVITGWGGTCYGYFEEGFPRKSSEAICSDWFNYFPTVLTFTQGHNGAKGDMVSVPSIFHQHITTSQALTWADKSFAVHLGHVTRNVYQQAKESNIIAVNLRFSVMVTTAASLFCTHKVWFKQLWYADFQHPQTIQVDVTFQCRKSCVLYVLRGNWSLCSVTDL